MNTQTWFIHGQKGCITFNVGIVGGPDWLASSEADLETLLRSHFADLSKNDSARAEELIRSALSQLIQSDYVIIEKPIAGPFKQGLPNQ